jgi:hypothetical protein
MRINRIEVIGGYYVDVGSLRKLNNNSRKKYNPTTT